MRRVHSHFIFYIYIVSYIFLKNVTGCVVSNFASASCEAESSLKKKEEWCSQRMSAPCGRLVMCWWTRTSKIMVRLNTKIDSYLRFPLLVLTALPQKKTDNYQKHLICVVQPKKYECIKNNPLVFPYLLLPFHTNNHALQLDFLLKKPA